MALGTSPAPKKKIIVVQRGDEGKPLADASGYWVYGPRTQYRWPGGDFHYGSKYGSGKRIVSEAAWTLAEILAMHDVVVYDPDNWIDEGL